MSILRVIDIKWSLLFLILESEEINCFDWNLHLFEFWYEKIYTHETFDLHLASIFLIVLFKIRKKGLLRNINLQLHEWNVFVWNYHEVFVIERKCLIFVQVCFNVLDVLLPRWNYICNLTRRTATPRDSRSNSEFSTVVRFENQFSRYIVFEFVES